MVGPGRRSPPLRRQVAIVTMKPDDLDRTLKLEFDDGRASTIAKAKALTSRYVLQVHVGEGVGKSPTAQAALLTALNSASRAFVGGVRVVTEDDPDLSVSWARGKRLSEAIEMFGGQRVAELAEEYATIVIGEPRRAPTGAPALFCTWAGWSAGIVQTPSERLDAAPEFPLAGVASGGLAVSEAFQAIRGNVVAARRTVGLSLWRPDLDWRDARAIGPTCSFLPSRFWLIGLGHLGQAYAWAIGFLPYSAPQDVVLMAQDFDAIVPANAATGLLVPRRLVKSEQKARLVARRLESIGFQTRITERRFGDATRREPHEPALALAGLDDLRPRRALEGAGFDLIVDAGLGAGPEHYLDCLIHSFPSGLTAKAAWPEIRPNLSNAEATAQRPAYQDFLRREVARRGLTEEEVRCGLLEVAGRTVGAAFVGAVTATLVLAEPIRNLCGGDSYEVIGLSLRSPQHRDVATNSAQRQPANFGFQQTAS